MRTIYVFFSRFFTTETKIYSLFVFSQFEENEMNDQFFCFNCDICRGNVETPTKATPAKKTNLIERMMIVIIIMVIIIINLIFINLIMMIIIIYLNIRAGLAPL